MFDIIITMKKKSVAEAQESERSMGQLWRMSGRHGVAYLSDVTLAGELLQIDPKQVSQTAMATYYDKKGRAFAWQVRFDTARWAEMEERLRPSLTSSVLR
jgi:hypothetical protein